MAPWTSRQELREREREARDAMAREVFTDPRGVAGEYGIYLRPFELDRAMRVHVWASRFSRLAASDWWSIDEALSYAAPVPLVALGPEAREALGAGSAGFIEDGPWLERVALAAEHARLVVIVPSWRDGTFQELALVQRRGWWSKTVVVNLPFNVGPWRTHDFLAWEWAATAQRAATLGLSLPVPFQDGGLWARREDGSWWGVALREWKNTPLRLRGTWEAFQALRGVASRPGAPCIRLAEPDTAFVDALATGYALSLGPYLAEAGRPSGPRSAFLWFLEPLLAGKLARVHLHDWLASRSDALTRDQAFASALAFLQRTWRHDEQLVRPCRYLHHLSIRRPPFGTKIWWMKAWEFVTNTMFSPGV